MRGSFSGVYQWIAAVEPLRQAGGVFGHRCGIVGIEERVLDPRRQPVVDEIDLRRDTERPAAARAVWSAKSSPSGPAAGWMRCQGTP